MIRVTDNLSIPEEEISFSASRSSGPGGQHVNTSSTRVTLRFDVQNSPSLTDEQRERILRHLANRISRDGILAVSAQDARSQAANRRAATVRLTDLLRSALARSPARVPSQKPASADRRRLEKKRRRGERKRSRSWRPGPEDR